MTLCLPINHDPHIPDRGKDNVFYVQEKHNVMGNGHHKLHIEVLLTNLYDSSQFSQCTFPSRISGMGLFVEDRKLEISVFDLHAQMLLFRSLVELRLNF